MVLDRPRESSGQGCTEPVVQETHVVKVSLAWFVATGVAQHLKLRCEAHHLAACDGPVPENPDAGYMASSFPPPGIPVLMPLPSPSKRTV